MKDRCDCCKKEFDGRKVKLTNKVRDILSHYGYNKICPECLVSIGGN